MTATWRGGGVPQERENATIIVLDKKTDPTEFGSYRGISLVARVGKALLKVIANRLSNYCERKDMSPEKQCGSRSQRPTIDMIVACRRHHQLARKKKRPSSHVLRRPHQKTYQVHDSVDRNFAPTVLARFGVPPKGSRGFCATSKMECERGAHPDG